MPAAAYLGYQGDPFLDARAVLADEAVQKEFVQGRQSNARHWPGRRRRLHHGQERQQVPETPRALSARAWRR